MSKQETQKTQQQQFSEYVSSLENQVTISHQKAQEVAKACMGNILQQLQQSMQMTGAKEVEIKRLQEILNEHRIDYTVKAQTAKTSDKKKSK